MAHELLLRLYVLLFEFWANLFKLPPAGPLAGQATGKSPGAPDGLSGLACTPVTRSDIWHAGYPVTLHNAVCKLMIASLNSSQMPTVVHRSAL